MTLSSLLLVARTSLIFLLLALPARAHELRPAIADMKLETEKVSVSIALNLEAVIAGIGAEHDDTDDAPEAALYEELRANDPEALREAFDAEAQDFLSNVTMQTGDTALSPTISDLTIPAVGDVDLSRESILILNAALPAETSAVVFGWDESLGPLILRAPGKTEPYSAYLTAGTLSDPIPVTGAEARGTLETVWDYIVLGFEHILPKGLDHILFVVGLFLLAARLRPLLWQVTAFTLAHTVTLALGITGVVSISPSIVEPLIAASIVWVCIENIFSEKMATWRPVVVFAFGLLHGLGFAGVLGEIGLPPSQFITALLSFNIGVELGQLTVIAACFLAVGLWFRNKPWYRSRITIPASILIACVGAYWFVERTLLA
jgi:hydrogenase/urease accessory protein HupE